MRQYIGSALAQIMAWRRIGDVPLSKLMLVIAIGHLWINFSEILIQNQNTKRFIHTNASENIACEIAAILFRAQCVEIMIWCPIRQGANILNENESLQRRNDNSINNHYDKQRIRYAINTQINWYLVRVLTVKNAITFYLKYLYDFKNVSSVAQLCNPYCNKESVYEAVTQCLK